MRTAGDVKGSWPHLETSKALAMRQQRAQRRVHHAICDVQSLHAVRPIEGGVDTLQPKVAPLKMFPD